MYGFSGPFMAAFVNLFGLKRMMVYSMSLLVVGLLLSLIMKEQWQLIIIWGVIIGIGSGLFLTVLSAQVANRWFFKHRGLAVGILTAATATGQLVLLPILASLIEKYDWRQAILLILMLALIMLVIILLYMKESPSAMNIRALGEIEPSATSKAVLKTRNPFTLVFLSLYRRNSIEGILAIGHKLLYLRTFYKWINRYTFY